MFDIHYFGNINYYYTLLKPKAIEFATLLPYQKGWFNNKCVIASSNGPLNLSIPLLGGRNQHIALKDVRIAYHQNWRRQHLRAIETCYRNAPFFEFYFFKFEQLFENEFEYLIDFNIASFKLVSSILKIDQPIVFNDACTDPKQVQMSKKYNKTSEVLDMSFLKYEQVFENSIGFLKNISIIDLIFCAGTRSNQLLNNTFTA